MINCKLQPNKYEKILSSQYIVKIQFENIKKKQFYEHFAVILHSAETCIYLKTKHTSIISIDKFFK